MCLPPSYLDAVDHTDRVEVGMTITWKIKVRHSLTKRWFLLAEGEDDQKFDQIVECVHKAVDSSDYFIDYAEIIHLERGRCEYYSGSLLPTSLVGRSSVKYTTRGGKHKGHRVGGVRVR